MLGEKPDYDLRQFKFNIFKQEQEKKCKTIMNDNDYSLIRR